MASRGSGTFARQTPSYTHSNKSSNKDKPGAAQVDLSGDVAIQDPPGDSVSAIRFSTAGKFLAVTSWDKTVRVYEINAAGQSKGVAMWDHEKPVLGVDWSKDDTKIASCGTEGGVKVFDVKSGQSIQVGTHDRGIKGVKWVTPSNQSAEILITGGWDKKLKYWDVRSPSMIGSIELQERVYAMDALGDSIVLALAERYIDIIDLKNPGKLMDTMQSPLKWQTRTVRCMDEGKSFALGSIEGRCAIQWIPEDKKNLNFSFKCHRKQKPETKKAATYAVNAISCHPIYGTMMTGGSDGTFVLWDKDSKQKLTTYPEVRYPVVATDFSADGKVFAYALSYDWMNGSPDTKAEYPTKIMLHSLDKDEGKQKPLDDKKPRR